MRPLQQRKRRVVAGGVRRTVAMGIDEADMPQVLGMLSDNLYQNRIGAVVREYSCNAWDAHVAHGIPNKPITVILPTAFVPEFVVRDHGPGMSEEQIYTVYSRYGKSTKRHTNAQKGFFGIGAKSAYAYTTAYTIISYHSGLKVTYSAFVNEDRQRIVAKMTEEARGTALNAFFALSNGSALDADEYHDVVDALPEASLLANRAQCLAEYDELTGDADPVQAAALWGAYIPEKVERVAEGDFGHKEWVEWSTWAALSPEGQHAEIRRQVEAFNTYDFLIVREPAELVAFRSFARDIEDAETGMEIRVPVQQRDCRAFRTEAEKVYRFFEPFPDCDVPQQDVKKKGTWLPGSRTVLFQSWASAGFDTRWTIVMGNVAYALPLAQLREKLGDTAEENEELRDLLKFVDRAAGVIYVDIGELEPAPNRESLSLSPVGQRFLVQKLAAVRVAVSQHMLEMAQHAFVSTWDLRIRLRRLLADLGLQHEKVGEIHLTGNAPLPIMDADKPKTFNIRSFGVSRGLGGAPTTAVIAPAKFLPRYATATKSPLLVIRDEQQVAKRLLFYQQTHGHVDIYLVDPIAADYTYDSAELSEFLKRLGVDGIPQQKLSSFEMPEPLARKSRLPHYSKTRFVWNGGNTRRRRKSSDWDPHGKDTLEDGSVYVYLDNFVPDVHGILSGGFRSDELMLRELFGFTGEMPTLYGVKRSLKSKRVNPKAVHYTAWVAARVAERESDVFRTVQKMLRSRAWADMDDAITLPMVPKPARMAHLQKELGASHPILKLFRRLEAGKREWKEYPHGQRTAVERFHRWASATAADKIGRYSLRIQAAVRERVTSVTARYPLLSLIEDSPISVLAHPDRKVWSADQGIWIPFSSILAQYIQYIQLMDNFHAAAQSAPQDQGSKP